MKIVIDLRPILTGRLTGVETVGLELSKRLVHNHPEDEFIFWYSGHKDVREKIEWFKDWIDFDQLDNAELRIWKIPSILLEGTLMTLYAPSLDRFLDSPDVFWEPNPRSVPMGGSTAKITTFHDLSRKIYPEFFPQKSNLYSFLIGLEREVTTSDKLVAVSHSTKMDLIKFFGVEADKIEVVYNGVDSKYFKDPESETIERVTDKLNIDNEFILSLGTIEPRKNLVNLIKAYRHAYDKWDIDQKLLLAGAKGWNGYDDAVRQEIKNQHVSHKVEILGRVSEEEKLVLLNQASLFVYPSWYEGFGLPPLEAMAAGTPVVTSNTSSIPEVVGDSAETVDPGNPQQIGKAMAQLLKNEKLAKSLRVQGRLQAQKFTWERAAESLYSIFKQYGG